MKRGFESSIAVFDSSQLLLAWNDDFESEFADVHELVAQGTPLLKFQIVCMGREGIEEISLKGQMVIRFSGSKTGADDSLLDADSTTTMARAVSRLKSEFLTTMNHEIRTPLNGIIGMAQLLASSEISPSDIECVQTIISSGEALLALIDRVTPFQYAEEKDDETSSNLPLRDRAGPHALRVLLAEDNIINQRVIIMALERRGISVAVAQNGAEALEMVQDSSFDLVLMDIHMPVMSGDEATRQIRRLGSEHSQVPIIVLTADVLDDARARYLAAGANDYLSKPINLSKLLSKVNRLYPSQTA